VEECEIDITAASQTSVPKLPEFQIVQLYLGSIKSCLYGKQNYAVSIIVALSYVSLPPIKITKQNFVFKKKRCMKNCNFN
jgi:hypothetical protein